MRNRALPPLVFLSLASRPLKPTRTTRPPSQLRSRLPWSFTYRSSLRPSASAEAGPNPNFCYPPTSSRRWGKTSLSYKARYICQLRVLKRTLYDNNVTQSTSTAIRSSSPLRLWGFTPLHATAGVVKIRAKRTDCGKGWAYSPSALAAAASTLGTRKGLVR